MPLYDIEHTYPLSALQQADLAVAFTDLHSSRFSTPRIFVNVRFTDASNGPIVFRGGVLRKAYNRVILRTRAGEMRSKELYDDHCRSVVEVWDRIVGTDTEDKALRTVWVMAALTTALECGISRPKVGEEKEWLEKNRPEFQRLADEGDEDFIELMKDLNARSAA